MSSQPGTSAGRLSRSLEYPASRKRSRWSRCRAETGAHRRRSLSTRRPPRSARGPSGQPAFPARRVCRYLGWLRIPPSHPEEIRCLPQVSEQRAPLQPLCHKDVDAHVGSAISAGEGHVELPRGLADIEGRAVVLAGEEAPARNAWPSRSAGFCAPSCGIRLGPGGCVAQQKSPGPQQIDSNARYAEDDCLPRDMLHLSGRRSTAPEAQGEARDTTSTAAATSRTGRLGCAGRPDADARHLERR